MARPSVYLLREVQARPITAFCQSRPKPDCAGPGRAACSLLDHAAPSAQQWNIPVKEDLAKCQLLTVSRHAYRTLAEERLRVNSYFGRKILDQQAVDALPENGVPQQFIDCGAQMPEVDRYKPTRCGPGTIRDPLDAAKEDDNASDELSEKSGDECDAEGHHGECGDNEQQPSSLPGDMQLNSFETPIGLDPTASPDFVQHVRVCHIGSVPNRRKHVAAVPLACRGSAGWGNAGVTLPGLADRREGSHQ